MSSNFQGPGSPYGNAIPADPNGSGHSDPLNEADELTQNSTDISPVNENDPRGRNDPRGNAVKRA